ncbi:hypothetical protein [Synechococcus sp. PCC 7336]|nr:hypothetical protein [Synechococcus sp. PCC 7336]
MVSVLSQPSNIHADRWRKGSWAEFDALVDSPALAGSRFDCDRGQMRI